MIVLSLLRWGLRAAPRVRVRRLRCDFTRHAISYMLILRIRVSSHQHVALPPPDLSACTYGKLCPMGRMQLGPATPDYGLQVPIVRVPQANPESVLGDDPAG